MIFVGKVQKTLKANLERVSLNYIIKTSFCPRFVFPRIVSECTLILLSDG